MKLIIALTALTLIACAGKVESPPETMTGEQCCAATLVGDTKGDACCVAWQTEGHPAGRVYEVVASAE